LPVTVLFEGITMGGGFIEWKGYATQENYEVPFTSMKELRTHPRQQDLDCQIIRQRDVDRGRSEVRCTLSSTRS
jgi:hypothetical protein